MTYGNYTITRYYSDHWQYQHNEFDGAPDSGDKRNGFAATLCEAKAAIDELENELL